MVSLIQNGTLSIDNSAIGDQSNGLALSDQIIIGAGADIAQGAALTVGDGLGGALGGALGGGAIGTPVTADIQSHLVINAEFTDPTMVALQSSNLAEYNGYVSAINTAINYYENLITNPITLSISFAWNSIGTTVVGGLGMSNANLYSTTYSQLYSAVSGDFSTGSAVQRAALASLPGTDPTGGAAFQVTFAQIQALGLTGFDTSGDAGTVAISGSTAWAFAQSSIPSTSYDAVGVVEHEISEVLGRQDNGGANGQYTLLDMFRYTAAGNADGAAVGSPVGTLDQPFVAGYSASNNSYFSANGTTLSQEYDTPANVAGGADIADWGPNTIGDSFGAGSNGTVGAISAADLQTLQVIGMNVACFVTGTRLATPGGDVAVECLEEGALVLTDAGEARAVRWVGRRTLHCAAHPTPEDVWPVRVRAGAFGPALPMRDLLLSPDHAVFIDDWLMPVRALVNGASIAQEPWARVTYWHVELASHDVILAEGLPVETYLDTGNRAAFENGADIVQLHPRFGRAVHTALACAPFVDVGRPVAAVRDRLAARVPALGFGRRTSRWHVEADGRALAAAADGSFLLPAGTRQVTLVSETGRPLDLEPGSTDTRHLGVAIAGMRIDGEALSLAEGAWEGFHAAEWDGATCWRWSTGRATLPVEAGLNARRLDLAIAALPLVWTPPSEPRRAARG